MMAWIKSNRLLSIVLLVCIGFFAYYIYNAICWIPYPNSIDYGEGFVMNYAKLWASGTWKWDINTPPYLTMVYGVGFPILATPLVHFFGATLMVGRSISFVSAIIVCVLLYLIVKELTGKKIYGLLAFLLPATQPIFRDWSVMARVDMPSVMFDILGLYIAIKFRNSKWFYLSVIPFLIAPMIKLTAIAGLGAVVVYLLIHNRKRLLVFTSLYLVGLAGMIVPLMLISNGKYLNHIIVYQNTIQKINPGTFYFLLGRFVYPFIILFILSVVYMKKCWRRKDLNIIFTFLAISFSVDIFTTFRPGGSGMYYFEAIMAGSICACLALPYMVSYLKKNQLQFQHVAIICVLVVVSLAFGVRHDIEPPDKHYTDSITKIGRIMSDSQQPIITENPAIALNMGKDLYVEYFIFTNLTRLGYWNPDNYADKYDEQYFDYILLRVPLATRLDYVRNGLRDGNFTNDILETIDKNYTLIFASRNEYISYSLFLYEANNKLKNDDRFITKGSTTFANVDYSGRIDK